MHHTSVPVLICPWHENCWEHATCAHHYVLDVSKLLMWKESGGTSQTAEPWTTIKQTHTCPWWMVGTYRASTCAGTCLIMRRNLRPNHPQIFETWIVPARWPTVVSTNQGNISPRIMCRFSFAADTMKLCIKKIFFSLVHVTWLSSVATWQVALGSVGKEFKINFTLFGVGA